MQKMWNQIREVEILYNENTAYKITYEDIDINFKIYFTNDKNSNICEIRMYNLSTNTINNIKKENHIKVKSGYEDFNGDIFIGKIDNVSTQLDGLDRVTILTCSPDATSWNNEFINKSWRKGIKAKEIVQQIASMVGWSIGMLDIGELQYNGGKVFRKLAKNCLQEIAKDTNSLLYFNNGIIYMYPANKIFKKTIVLSPLNGLLDTPIKDISNNKKEEIYKIKCGLRYDFQEDTIIRIENSKYIDPVDLKITSGVHVANDNEFYSELECMKITDISKDINNYNNVEIDDI